MPFPHPKSREDDHGKGNKPNDGSVVRKLFKRTINVTRYRNGKDEVNPAHNRTFGGVAHDWFVFS